MVEPSIVAEENFGNTYCNGYSPVFLSVTVAVLVSPPTLRSPRSNSLLLSSRFDVAEATPRTTKMCLMLFLSIKVILLVKLPAFVGLNVTGNVPVERAAMFCVPLDTSNWSEEDVTFLDACK